MENYIVSEAGFLGGQEIIILLIIVVLLFGAKKIPELMKGVGKGIKEFKNVTNEEDNDNSPTSKT